VLPSALRNPRGIATRFLPDATVETGGPDSLASPTSPASEAAGTSARPSSGEAQPSSPVTEPLAAIEEKVMELELHHLRGRQRFFWLTLCSYSGRGSTGRGRRQQRHAFVQSPRLLSPIPLIVSARVLHRRPRPIPEVFVHFCLGRCPHRLSSWISAPVTPHTCRFHPLSAQERQLPRRCEAARSRSGQTVATCPATG
jgi:hypothetical protein